MAHVRRGDAGRKTKQRDLARERPPRALSATSINKTITRLGQILEVALEYGLIDRNTARGKRRRLKVSKPCPVWLDRAEHIEALLDAASATGPVRQGQRWSRSKGRAGLPPCPAGDVCVRRPADWRDNRAPLARR